MKHFVIISLILLFCFGVLPEFVINNAYGGIERTAKEVQMSYEKSTIPLPEDIRRIDDDLEVTSMVNANKIGAENNDTENDVNNEKENSDKQEIKDEIKIKPWLEKNDKESIKEKKDLEQCEESMASNKNFPIEEKMINDHKRERARKEIPGSNNLSIVCDIDLQKKCDYAQLLKIVDNATVVLNDGIINV